MFYTEIFTFLRQNKGKAFDMKGEYK